MKINKFFRGGLFLFLFFCLFFNLTPAKAIKIENLQNLNLVGDFIVGPGKQEIALDPGQTVVKYITVTNRFAKPMKFKLELEDFKGSSGTESAIELLGLLKGPYSLKDYLKPESMEFTLQPADRATLAVQISAPKDAVPGGLYGAVIVSTQTESDEQENENIISSGVDIKSRIAVLYFVRVKGPVKESGSLIFFKTDNTFYQKPKIDFVYGFKNDGSVYLNPYGYIEVKNFYGTVVDKIKIDPYYILPGSERTMKKSLTHSFMLGRYTAEISINRGYTVNNIDKQADIIDTQKLVFWVLPWNVIVPVLAGVLLLIWLIVWIKNNVQINIKRSDNENKQT